MMWHFIWVFNVCKSTCLGASSLNNFELKLSLSNTNVGNLKPALDVLDPDRMWYFWHYIETYAMG